MKMDWWEDYVSELYGKYGFQHTEKNIPADIFVYALEDSYPLSSARQCSLVRQFGGYGVQLDEDVSAGTFIIEYTGELISPERMKIRSSKFLMNVVTWLHDLYIDASHFGNIARFINHSCNPNCRVKMCIHYGLPTACLFSKHSIKSETMLTFDYFTNEEVL